MKDSCYHHALSSVKKWGGTVDDFIAVHAWFDQSKEITADFRHRALRHHAEGIFMAETIFGPTLTLSTGRIIPIRWVGEQHVKEDLGFIPSFADWVKAIHPEPWMGRTERMRLWSIRISPRPWSRSPDMTDPAYQGLGLLPTASPYAVLRAAVRALHPDTRAVRGFRAARKRFYRQMLWVHAARQAAGDDPAS